MRCRENLVGFGAGLLSARGLLFGVVCVCVHVYVLFPPTSWGVVPYSQLSSQALLIQQILETTPDHVSVVAWRR